MQLFPTFQTLKLVTVAVVVVRESTLRVAALLGCVLWLHAIHVDAMLFGLVFDVALEFTERPPLEL